MKKLIIALALGTFCFFGTNTATFAQHGAGEEFVKSLTQNFNESDFFTTVDDEDGFEKRFVVGYPRVYRWYYRPVIVRPVVWRPVYYRPVYMSKCRGRRFFLSATESVDIAQMQFLTDTHKIFS